MTYNKERHKQLVICAQELKNQGKDLNLEKDFELCKYNILVEEQVFWTHRENFILIIKNFLENTLDFDEFETSFSVLYNKVRKEVNLFTRDLEQIDNFQPSTRPYRFASVIGAIYRTFEEVEDEYCTEQELKDYVKESYLEIQKFEE
jgi:hypothetical protein